MIRWNLYERASFLFRLRLIVGFLTAWPLLSCLAIPCKIPSLELSWKPKQALRFTPTRLAYRRLSPEEFKRMAGLPMEKVQCEEELPLFV
jgi:hypothetical protein